MNKEYENKIEAAWIYIEAAYDCDHQAHYNILIDFKLTLLKLKSIKIIIFKSKIYLSDSF
ncbi:hypothetical protein CWI39_2816p0010 [Hamiltosporidium magnivora]|uniref:Uncharacterized protein n=1 Tax=Hamiltosporidium magnivora TaxID=148818 RepID=A0A4Q9KSL9_9MICR|nr:hypothetical protein CWI39_2816p0010 [Hamiltosporidium magnivora]